MGIGWKKQNRGVATEAVLQSSGLAGGIAATELTELIDAPKSDVFSNDTIFRRISTKGYMMASSRRRFLAQALSGSGLITAIPAWSFAKSWWSDELIATPPQGRGPFYPVPEIDKQKHYDADLTRLDDASPVADGEQIVVRGSVVGLDDRPLQGVVVEIWQACASGRYNHPREGSDRPIDPNFQYWARMLTSEEGLFSFRTILPGKYPERAPHIHYRIIAPRRPELVTQMYFEKHMEFNRADGIYRELTSEQRRAVTVAMESLPLDPSTPTSATLPTGNFKIVLGPLSDSKSTRPM
jgi:protocatechuate 3,4-dioxygenase beta subunit